MGPDEQVSSQRQINPDTPLARDVAMLSFRVDALERELASLRRAAPLHAPLQPPDRPPARPARQPKASLEDRIGSQLFSRIGVAALLVATALFLKWAIDNQWIGPTARVLAGLAAGAAVILWSERFRRRQFPAFAYALKAIGSGAIYLSLWAAFQLYHLLPAVLALCALLLVTAWNAFMAWSQHSELLAAYALAGALATPLLLSTAGNHEIFLFTYLLTIDLATIVLVGLRSWPRLLLAAFPVTVAYFIAWYIGWYNAASPNQPAALTILFLALFFVAFVVPSLRISFTNESTHAATARTTELTARPALRLIREVFLPLANAAFTALALYSVLQDAGYHDLLPRAALLLAAIYLGLMRIPQTKVASAVHLALAVVFLTVAIPLKLTGHWITIAWLSEGAALLWLSTRFQIDTGSQAEPQDRVALRASREPLFSPGPNPSAIAFPSSAASTLRRLATGPLSLGFLGLLLQPLWLYSNLQTAFLNPRFAAALFGIAVFALSTALSLRAARKQNAIQNAASQEWLNLAAASSLALNLIAILACVRELETAFLNPTRDPDVDLQLSLAISAFLMLYGTCLLAAGFWRRSAFLRWQALVLLVLTIGKVFLYDLRNLAQGYRVLSFFGLGTLLMAISFAYQKDWLALRNRPPLAATAPPPNNEANRQANRAWHPSGDQPSEQRAEPEAKPGDEPGAKP